MIKLQVVFYPATEASGDYGLNPQHLSSMLQLQSQMGHMNLWPNPARKLLHLTTPTKTLMEVCEEVKKRYAKLYPGDETLRVEQVRDALSCDLDPDYLVGDIFENGDTIQFVVNNTFEPSYSFQSSNILERLVTFDDGQDDSSRINPHSVTSAVYKHPISSTPVSTPAPLLSRKRLSNFFETADSNLPRKVRKSSIWNDSTNESFVQKASGGARRGRKPKVTPNSSMQQEVSSPVHESNISLPPPDYAPSEEEMANIIPHKRNTRIPAKNKSVQRVTSGMLSIPAETQSEVKSSVDRALGESTPVSNKFSNGANGLTIVVPKRRGRPPSNPNAAANGETAPRPRGRRPKKDIEAEKAEKEREKSIAEAETTTNEEVDTMTKDEIMGIFLNGMKFPANRSQNYNPKQVQTLKSLQITMNDEGTISTTGRTMGEVEPERTSRHAAQEASKKFKEEGGRKKRKPDENAVTTITNTKYGTTVATTSKIDLAKEDGRRTRWERRNSTPLIDSLLSNTNKSRSTTRTKKTDKEESERSKTPSRRRRSKSQVKFSKNDDVDMEKSLDEVSVKSSERGRKSNVENVEQSPYSDKVLDTEMMEVDSPTATKHDNNVSSVSSTSSTASRLSKIFDRVRTIDETINPIISSKEAPVIDMDASTVPTHALPVVTLESQGSPKSVINKSVENPTLSVLERARLGLKTKKASGGVSSVDGPLNTKRNGHSGSMNSLSLEERQKAEKQRIKKRAEQLRLAKQNLDKARRQSLEKISKTGSTNENSNPTENQNSESLSNGTSGIVPPPARERPPAIAEKNSHMSSSDEDMSASDNESEEEVSKKNPRVVELPSQGSVLKRPEVKSITRVQSASTRNLETPDSLKSKTKSPESVTPSIGGTGSNVGSATSSKSSQLSRLPTLTSLSDLAMRGVPEVRDSNGPNFVQKPMVVETRQAASSGEDSSDSSSSDDDSGSDSDYKDAKFINSKKFKKTSKKGGFFDLMKDANKI